MSYCERVHQLLKESDSYEKYRSIDNREGRRENIVG
jgi:hypothetical protein